METNPQAGDRGTILVGVGTWVRATGDAPMSVTAAAAAGNASVTVTAAPTGLQLSAPDGNASRADFGIPWRSGMPEGSSPCTISFNHSSAHLGGTTPLTIQIAYTASCAATDGSAGTLSATTATAPPPAPSTSPWPRSRP